MTTELDRLTRLPKAQLAQLVLAFTQGVPAPVDADVAPTPEPEAPKADKAKAKAKPRVKCAIKAHTADTCDPKARFWSAKGANNHVAKLDRSSKN